MENDFCNVCQCPAGSGSCPGCAAVASIIDDYCDTGGFCDGCGKEFEDFSDLGCEKCDQRHPGYGTMP
jgi:hypothetical protein